MYARKVGKQTLTFRVSGQLWNQSLVMQDLETKSLWSHILGEAKSGPLKGKKLTVVPSVITSWQKWRTQFPESTVVLLRKTSSFDTRAFAALDQYVLGIHEGGKAKAWAFSTMNQNPALNDEFAGEPVLVAFDKQSRTARLYQRKVGMRVLTFAMVDGQLVDKETNSVWHPISGQALKGPLKGTWLSPLPAFLSYRHVWKGFHPDSEYGPGDRRQK
ncbi:MAG: hypothetical protein KatS3mg105_1487 [Gemmatales bacterium]|nr:MAG: hypothetical protein KatS3mg105_1487 [Gemmatales bacterium]